jgi:hypothetical protein
MGAVMDKEKEEQQSFRVTDKRGFSEEGDVRAPENEAPVNAKADSASPVPEEKSAEREAPPRPPIDFPSYILSYYTQGLVLLGEVPNPYTNKKEEDVDAARHTVDILSMLQQKTKGNLSKDEEQLLDSVLYELRIKFMAKTNRIKI